MPWGLEMDLEAKVADIDKTLAVQGNDIKNHLERDNERFDHIVRGIDTLSRDMATLTKTVDRGITRVHERVDTEVANRDKGFAALRAGHFQTKIWVLTGALTFTMAMAWYFFTDRMDDAKRVSVPAAVAGAQAAEQQN